MLSFRFHRSPLLCAYVRLCILCPVFGLCWYLWPFACFCKNLMFNISFGCCRHSVCNTFVQLTEGRSARDQPKQPAKKKTFFFLLLCCAHYDDGDSLGWMTILCIKCKKRGKMSDRIKTTKTAPNNKHTTTTRKTLFRFWKRTRLMLRAETSIVNLPGNPHLTRAIAAASKSFWSSMFTW